MSDDARIPSVEQIREVYEALWTFIQEEDREPRPTCLRPDWRREDQFLPIFSNLADALRPVRPLLGSMRGWDFPVGRALRVIVERFDATARQWGWEEVSEPEPRRSAFIRRQRARFREDVVRPLLVAAITYQERWIGLDCPKRVDVFARWGRAEGFASSPSMSLADAQAAFGSAGVRWEEALWLGSREPKMNEDEKKGLTEAFQSLSDTLKAEGFARDWKPRPPTAATGSPGRPDGVPQGLKSSAEETPPVARRAKRPRSEGETAAHDEDIPPERRTRELTLGEAAGYLGITRGKVSETLANRIKTGKIKAIERSRQAYIFDLGDFKAEVRDKLRAP